MRAKLGTYRLWLYDLKRWWQQKRTRRRDPIPIWRNAIKAIEGHFGTAQSSFFVFVRWLFLLNLVQAIAYTAFVVLPMATTYDYKGNNGTFVFFNAFDGGGAAGTSWLFYGVRCRCSQMDQEKGRKGEGGAKKLCVNGGVCQWHSIQTVTYQKHALF